PEARKMKLPDGGYRLTYNAQTVTDCDSGLIVTVAVTNQGGDTGMLGPVMRQVQQEHGRLPDEVVVDSGYADAGDIEWLEREGTRVIMPPRNERKEKKEGKDPYRPKRRDKPLVAAWRVRMGTEE